MTGMITHPPTYIDRLFLQKRQALDNLIRLALTSQFPKVRRMASRMTKNATRRVVRAAIRVEEQRAYEQTVIVAARVLTFPEPVKRYGQVGTFTGD